MVPNSRGGAANNGGAQHELLAVGIEWSLKTERLLNEGRYEEWRDACRVVAELYPGHSIAAYTTERVTHPVADMAFDGDEITAAAILGSGLIATGSLEGELAIWDMANIDSPVFEAQLGPEAVRTVREGPKGGVAALRGANLFVWNPQSEVGPRYVPLDNDIGITALLCDDEKIFFGTWEGEIFETTVHGVPQCIWRNEPGTRVTELAITEEGQMLSFDMNGVLRSHGCVAELSGRSRSTPGLAVLGRDRFVTTVDYEEIVLWNGTRRDRVVASGYDAGRLIIPGVGGAFLGVRVFQQITEYSTDGVPFRTLSTNMLGVHALSAISPSRLIIAGTHGCEYLELDGADFLEPHDPAMDFLDPVPIESKPGTITAISSATPAILRWELGGSPKWKYIQDSASRDNGEVISLLDGGRILLDRNEDDHYEMVILNAEMGVEKLLNILDCYSLLMLNSGNLVACANESLYVLNRECDEPFQWITTCCDAALIELADGRILCAEGNSVYDLDGAPNRLILVDLSGPSVQTVAELPFWARGLTLTSDGKVHIYLVDSDRKDSVLVWDPSAPEAGLQKSQDVHALSLTGGPTQVAMRYRTHGLMCCSVQLPGGYLGMAQGRPRGLTVWAPASYTAML